VVNSGTSQLKYASMPSPRLLAATFSGALALAGPGTLSSNYELSKIIQTRHAEANRWITSQTNALRQLEPNWDGYDAEPLNPSIILRMETLLGDLLPHEVISGSIVPGADGSLQAEWHFDRASFGLLLEECGRLSCWVRPHEQKEIEEFELAARDLFTSAVITYLA